jgi:hypothetical protein
MILVPANAPYHHALLLAAFLRRHARDLRPLFLRPATHNRSQRFLKCSKPSTPVSITGAD